MTRSEIRRDARRLARVLSRIAAALFLCAAFGNATAAGDARRGQYLAQISGCRACHTATTAGAMPYAGGRALKTLFGTFYGPNITPDPQAGIGRWTEDDFIRAMREGRRPDGAHLFPAFPYPSFTKIRDDDLRDLWAFLRTLAPSRQANRKHDLMFPFSSRSLVITWKKLYFKPGPMTDDPRQTPLVNRGAYIVQALSHCGECHTPRNLLGGPDQDRFLAGTKSGPEGKAVPNLTPAKLKKWSDAELKDFLLTGLTPEGDVTAETMGEVVRDATSRMTPNDLAAVIAYLRSLPAIKDK